MRNKPRQKFRSRSLLINTKLTLHHIIEGEGCLLWEKCGDKIFGKRKPWASFWGTVPFLSWFNWKTFQVTLVTSVTNTAENKKYFQLLPQIHQQNISDKILLYNLLLLVLISFLSSSNSSGWAFSNRNPLRLTQIDGRSF